MNKRCENLPPYSRKKPRSDEGMLFTEQRARSLSDRDRDCFLKLLANPPAPTKDLLLDRIDAGNVFERKTSFG